MPQISAPPTDSVYPVSPMGDRFRTVPAPLDGDLQRRLSDIGKQDLNPRGNPADARHAVDA